MPPRHQTLPPAQTASAKEAQKSLYCELCSKGYSRMNDYEAHLSSYDHTHRQRLKDMKNMVKDPNAGAKARKAEAKESGLFTIKLASDGNPPSSGGSGFKKGGFKKSGFKNAFGAAADDNTPTPQAAAAAAAAAAHQTTNTASKPSLLREADEESDTEDEGYEVYDPRIPTD